MSEHSIDGSHAIHRDDLKTAQQRWIESTKGTSQQHSTTGAHVYVSTLTEPTGSADFKLKSGEKTVKVCKIKKIDDGRHCVSQKSSPRKTILTPAGPTFGYCNVPQLNLNSFPITASEIEASCKPDKEFVTGDGKVVKILRIEEPLQERMNKARSPRKLKTVIPCKDEPISNQKSPPKLARKSVSSSVKSGSQNDKIKTKKHTYYHFKQSDELDFDLNRPSAAENENFEPSRPRDSVSPSEVIENENKNVKKSKTYDVSKTRDFIKQKRKEREDQVALEKRRKMIEKEEKRKKLNEIRETQKRIMKSIKKRPLDDNLVNCRKMARPQWIGPMEPQKQSAPSSGKISVPEPKNKSCSSSITGAISFKKLSQPNSPVNTVQGGERVDAQSSRTTFDKPPSANLVDIINSSLCSSTHNDLSPRRKPSRGRGDESVESSAGTQSNGLFVFEGSRRHVDENEANDSLSFLQPATPVHSSKTGSAVNRLLESDVTQSPQYVSVMDKFLAECSLSRAHSKKAVKNADLRTAESNCTEDIDCDPLNFINSVKRKLASFSGGTRLAPSFTLNEEFRLQVPVKDGEDSRVNYPSNCSEDIKLLAASRERVEAFRFDELTELRNRPAEFGLRLPDNLALASHLTADSDSVSSRSCSSQMPDAFRYDSSERASSVLRRSELRRNELDSSRETGGYTSESISEVIQISRLVSRESTVMNEEVSEIHNATSFSTQSLKFNTSSVKNQIQSGIDELDRVDQNLSSFLISTRRDTVRPMNITARDSNGLEASNVLSKIVRDHSSSSSVTGCSSSKEFELPHSSSIASRSSPFCQELARPSASTRSLDMPSVSLQVVEDLIKEGATIADRNITSLKQKAKSVKSRATKEIECLETQRKKLLDAGQDEEARELKRKQRKLLLKMTEEIKEIQRLRVAQENVARQRTLLLRQQQHLIKLQLDAQKRDTVHYSARTSRAVRSLAPELLNASGDYMDVDRCSTPFRDSLDRVARDLKTREEELRRRKEQAIVALKRKLDLEERNVKEIEKLSSLRPYSPAPVEAVDRGTSPFLEIENPRETELKLPPAVETQLRPTSPSESESLAKDYYSDSFDQSSVLSEVHPNVTLRTSLTVGRPKRMHPLVKPPLSPRATILKRRHSSESDESVAFSQNETLSELSDDKMDKARVCALKQQLKQRKAVWGKLNEEYQKNQKERLKATEKSLINQIQVYDSYIEQIKKALKQEIESGTVSVTRPQIKQPKFLDRKLSDKFASPNPRKPEAECTNSESSVVVSHKRVDVLDGVPFVPVDKEPATPEDSCQSAEVLVESEPVKISFDLDEASKASVAEIPSERTENGLTSEIKTIESNSGAPELAEQSEISENIEENVEEESQLTKQSIQDEVVTEDSDVDEETLKGNKDNNSENEISGVLSEPEKAEDDESITKDVESQQDEVPVIQSPDTQAVPIPEPIKGSASESSKISQTLSTEDQSAYEPTMKPEGSRRSISELINDSVRSISEMIDRTLTDKCEESVNEKDVSGDLPEDSIQHASTDKDETIQVTEHIEEEEETRIIHEETEVLDEASQPAQEESTQVETEEVDEQDSANLSTESHPVTEDLDNYLQELEKEEDVAEQRMRDNSSSLPEGGVLQMLRDSFQLSSDDKNTWEMNLAHFQDSGPGTPLITALQRERRQNINADMISKQICDMVVDDATTATVRAFAKKKIDGARVEETTKSSPSEDSRTVTENKKVGENEGFWLGEGLTLQTAREAEQLRLQQLQIEQEIEELEQAQVPYYYVRQIPNKPPPPYTPPRQSTPTREETIARVLLAAESLWDLEARGEDPSTAECPATYLASVSDPPYRQFMFDLAKELYLKLNPRPEQPGPPWTITKRFNRPLPPIKCKEQLLKHLERETKLVFGFETKIQRENMIMRWTKKRRGDVVDEILTRELQEEENEWSDFTVEETALKNQIADELIDQAIDEAVQSLAMTFSKKLFASS